METLQKRCAAVADAYSKAPTKRFAADRNATSRGGGGAVASTAVVSSLLGAVIIMFSLR